MLVVADTEFEVVGRTNNHLWLRLLHGQDAGMRLSVPVRDPDHSPDNIAELQRLEHGDVVRATLCSESDAYPDWRVDEVDPIDPASAVDPACDAVES